MKREQGVGKGIKMADANTHIYSALLRPNAPASVDPLIVANHGQGEGPRGNRGVDWRNLIIPLLKKRKNA